VSLKVIGNVTIRQSTYNFLFAFCRNFALSLPFARYNELFVESRKSFPIQG